MNILVVARYELVRDGLVKMLRQAMPNDRVFSAIDGQDALRVSRTVPPCLVLMNFGFSEPGVCEVAGRLLERHPDLRILFFASRSDTVAIRRALSAGARGYLLNDEESASMLEAIQDVRKNKIYLSPQLRGDVDIDQLIQARPKGSASSVAELTQRQVEVLTLIASGLSTRDIAARMGLSTKTLDAHRRCLQDRLNTHSIAEITRVAIAEGLVPLDVVSAGDVQQSSGDSG